MLVAMIATNKDKVTHLPVNKHRQIISEVVDQSGTDINCCLHCQSCGGGCPVSDAMTYRPNGIIRLLQLGFIQEALESSDIWFCIGCNTCSMACPQAIDIASMMDTVREMAIQAGVKIAEPDILNFHKEVINSIERHGRTHKLEIMMRYKIRTLDLFSDVDLGLKMLAKRKLDLRPSKVNDHREIDAIFENHGIR
jgi:heterodisulfide reductase subunit C